MSCVGLIAELCQTVISSSNLFLWKYTQLSQDLFVDFIYFLGIGKHHVPDDNKIAKTFALNCASLGEWKKNKTMKKKLILSWMNIFVIELGPVISKATSGYLDSFFVCVFLITMCKSWRQINFTVTPSTFHLCMFFSFFFFLKSSLGFSFQGRKIYY